MVHGQALAAALHTPGPSAGEPLPVAAFAGGVALGLILVLALAFLAVGVVLREPWYRRAVVLPGSALIALAGGYWTVARLAG